MEAVTTIIMVVVLDAALLGLTVRLAQRWLGVQGWGLPVDGP